MNPVTHSIQRQIEVNVETTHLQVGDDLFAYERRIGSQFIGDKQDGPSDLLRRGVSTGLVDGSQISVLAEGRVPNSLAVQWMSQETLELARTRGFNVAMDTYVQPENTLTACRNDLGGTAVRVDWGSHMLFDRHDKPLPVAVIFDYISSGVDEGHYDLQGLAEHLLMRQDVVVLSKNMKGSYSARQSTDEVLFNMAPRAKDVQDAVYNIPSYNAELGRAHSVQFVWMPDALNYQKVWDTIMQRKGAYPSTAVRRTVLELDILGAASFMLPPAPTPKRRKR